MDASLWVMCLMLCYILTIDTAVASIDSFHRNVIHWEKKQTAFTIRSSKPNLISPTRQKRATIDTHDNCVVPADYVNKLNSHRDKHVFNNDPNPSLSLTWIGNNGALLALTTSNNVIFVHPSKLYRSTNRGRSFEDISSSINSDYIRKANGINLSPVDKNMLILVGLDSDFSTTGTKLYITVDAGATFEKSVLPFQCDPSTLKFSPLHKQRLLMKSLYKHTLWISEDFGRKWTQVNQYVVTARWDPKDADTYFYTLDPLKKVDENSMENELYRVNIGTGEETLIAQHAHSFTLQDHYLLLSVQFFAKNGSRVLYVSKNQGHAWNAAQLPLIGSDEFYSLLDMSEDMVLIHVDKPGDTGHGDIYASDERGIIYSLSLHRHLFPNLGTITDFYKVASLPGVYITSQLSESNTVHSVISYDKGGAWQPLAAPHGSPCPETEEFCNLQIHNSFSASKRVRLPSLPVTSANTIGIILAHGNIGDGLSFHDPDVYVSRDGGYSWRQPANLTGPHYYGIGDSGGILYAVPAGVVTTNKILFSLDEGACWHAANFTDRPIQVTGISSEPGERATDVSIWGWDSDGDESWQALTVDFAPVIGRACQTQDYEVWQAHEYSEVTDDRCVLGAKTTYVRRKAGTVCRNGDQLNSQPSHQPCTCELADYLCDYGYQRNVSSLECTEDPSAATSNMDVCVDAKEEKIITQGYRKIPGDKCQGNEMRRSPKLVSKSCAGGSNAAVDPDQFIDYTTPQPPTTSSHTGLIVFLVVVVIGITVAFFSVLFYKKRSLLRIRYTSLQQTPPDDEETGVEPKRASTTRSNGSLLAGTTSLVGDDVLIQSPGALPNPTSGGGDAALISYHDDSDEDLLVT